MKYFLLLALISVAVQLSVAPPVNQKAKDEEDEGSEAKHMEELLDIGYRKYLMEVVQILESDPEFREKLEKADDVDIYSGKVAEQLQFVNHNVRTKLDEIKRGELERLRHLASKENELRNGLDVDHLKITEHLDHTNTRTFEIQDLKRLIAKTTKDLAEADKMRRQEFKHHEMEKKLEEQEKLKKMDDMEKKKYEEELKSLKEKQKKHEPLHHPGSKQQLEEVWEKQDHMETEDFNPRTFFFLHDIDGNGVWDQDEVKALFLKELDKLYTPGTMQHDLLKRTEEMERMREHVFNEADLNKDGLINFEEFVEQTKKPNFQRDEGWQGLDEQQIYTQEEFEAFEKQKQEIQDMISKGMLPPPHPGYTPGQPERFPSQHAQAPVPSQQYVDRRNPNQHLPQQQFQDQGHPQQYQQPQVVMPQQQYPPAPVQPMHGHIPQQQYQEAQVQHQQVPVQQQDHANEHQPLGQLPVPQHEQIPIQQRHEQVPLQQQHDVVNQIPQNIQHNDVPQQNNPSHSNSLPAQASVQQEVNRNRI